MRLSVAGQSHPDSTTSSHLSSQAKDSSHHLSLNSVLASHKHKTFFVTVNGKQCQALRDTGASALFVDEDLVAPGAPTKGEVRVTGFRKAFTSSYPVVLVNVVLPFYTGEAWAISVPGPLFPVLVGNTLHTPDGEWQVDPTLESESTTAAPVVTRSRSQVMDQDRRSTSVYPDPTVINLSRPALYACSRKMTAWRICVDLLGHPRLTIS